MATPLLPSLRFAPRAALWAVLLPACSDPGTAGLQPLRRVVGADSGSGDAGAASGGMPSEGNAGTSARAGRAGGSQGGAGAAAEGGAAGAAGSVEAAGSSQGGSTAAGAGGATGSAGSAGGVSSEPTGACNILADTDGWVGPESNACGIQGVWYWENDCLTVPDGLGCTLQQWPTGESFPNEGNGRMCAQGATGAVDDEAQFDAKWGALIGLNLNQSADSDGLKRPLGELPVRLLGFGFTLNGPIVPPVLRFNLPTAATADTPHFLAILSGAGSYEVLFDDPEISQGSWVTPVAALDPSQITEVQVQIPSQLDASVPFDFCLENLYGLY